jgi:hypothetical protein
VLTTQFLNLEREEQMAEKRRDATNRPSKKLIYAIMVLLLGVSTAIAQNKPDPLKSGFENPPDF